MAYVLGGVEIRNPISVSEKKIERFAQVQTLDGRIHRDYYNSLVGTSIYGRLILRMLLLRSIQLLKLFMIPIKILIPFRRGK